MRPSKAGEKPSAESEECRYTDCPGLFIADELAENDAFWRVGGSGGRPGVIGGRTTPTTLDKNTTITAARPPLAPRERWGPFSSHP